MYEKIEKWFLQGLCNEGMVLNAVMKGVISREEADLILEKQGGGVS